MFRSFRNYFLQLYSQMLNQKINVAKLFFILVVMDTTILTTASPFYPLEMQCLNTSKVSKFSTFSQAYIYFCHNVAHSKLRQIAVDVFETKLKLDFTKSFSLGAQTTRNKCTNSTKNTFKRNLYFFDVFKSFSFYIPIQIKYDINFLAFLNMYIITAIVKN